MHFAGWTYFSQDGSGHRWTGYIFEWAGSDEVPKPWMSLICRSGVLVLRVELQSLRQDQIFSSSRKLILIYNYAVFTPIQIHSCESIFMKLSQNLPQTPGRCNVTLPVRISQPLTQGSNSKYPFPSIFSYLRLLFHMSQPNNVRFWY